MSGASPPHPRIPLQLFPLGQAVTCGETATDTNYDFYLGKATYHKCEICAPYNLTQLLSFSEST